MPVVTMLQRSLRTACGTIHATRLRVLWAAVDAVTRGGRLTLTGIGRTLRSQTTVKHTIKRVDRLLRGSEGMTIDLLGGCTFAVAAQSWRLGKRKTMPGTI